MNCNFVRTILSLHQLGRLPRVCRAGLLAVIQLFAAAVGFFCPEHALAQAHLAHTDTSPSPALVIAFVGGFVHSDDGRHAEVQIARELQTSYGHDVKVEIFRNRERERARKLVLTWWNQKELGQRAGDEPNNAPLILFGHSWGASAVVSLARELQREGIPVSLTIQVDSVRKNGEDDSIIPANVSEAINFYQPDGLVHGRSKIMAEDPSRTKILGNLRFKYEGEPAECRAYPWYDRLFFRGHTAIECDPRVWSEVETLIRRRLPSSRTPPKSTAAGGVQ
jgi:hypothetical protein